MQGNFGIMNTEQYFYVTFENPLDKDKNAYIAVKAHNEQDVKEYAKKHYKDRRLFIYPENIFSGNEANYSDGCIEEISLVKN